MLLLSSSSSISSSTVSDSSCMEATTRHHLAFEIRCLLHHMPSKFLHLLRRILSFVPMFKTLRIHFEFEAIAVHNSTKEHVYTPSLGN
ncbi:hypothetical protein TNCV_4432121 [Trichonephila clavipes]|nr:hypothetical protein TNCV_4432121 [Trichonephila clavipes]